jgi:hypothetical protein
MFRNRFKRFRRKVNSTSIDHQDQHLQPKKRKLSVFAKSKAIPPIPPGEGLPSYNSHVKMLQDMFRRKNPSKGIETS